MTDITLPRATVEQALEALKYFRDTAICSADTDTANEVIPDLEAALTQQAEPVCKCDLRTRLVGDGCEVCNPGLAAELAQQAEPVEPAQKPITRLFGTLPVHDAQQAEPVEPVAEARYDGTLRWLEPHGVGLHRIQGPLFTAPPQRKPLTDEEIDALPWNGSPRQFARAVERALEEKNRGR